MAVKKVATTQVNGKLPSNVGNPTEISVAEHAKKIEAMPLKPPRQALAVGEVQSCVVFSIEKPYLV